MHLTIHEAAAVPINMDYNSVDLQLQSYYDSTVSSW